MLIGILGYAGAGKDTVASLLPGFERRAFADKLRDLALRINPWLIYYGSLLANVVEERGWEASKRESPEVRRLLQNLGQGAREVLGDSIWIDAVLPGNIIDYDALDIVVTDVRYPNEATRIDTFLGRLWVISKPGTGPVNSHASEGFGEWISQFVSRYKITTILNDGTLEDLPFAVTAALDNERKPDHLRINGATYSANACAFVARTLEAS